MIPFKSRQAVCVGGKKKQERGGSATGNHTILI